MSDSRLLKEIERGIREILEAMLQVIQQLLEEMKKRQKEIDLQMSVHIYHVVRAEMEKNISDQLRKQIPKYNISSIQCSNGSGKSIHFHLIEDQTDGKEHTFHRLEGDKFIFNRSDGKGEPVYLKIKELEQAMPALEGRIAAMHILSKLNDQQIIQSLSDSFKKEKREGISFSEAYQNVLSQKVKVHMHQSRKMDLTAAQKMNDFYLKRKNEIAIERDGIQRKKSFWKQNSATVSSPKKSLTGK